MSQLLVLLLCVLFVYWEDGGRMSVQDIISLLFLFSVNKFLALCVCERVCKWLFLSVCFGYIISQLRVVIWECCRVSRTPS